MEKTSSSEQFLKEMNLLVVCVMKIEPTLDTGGIYRKDVIPLNSGVYRKGANELCEKGTELLIDCFKSGFGVPKPQIGDAVYTR